MAGGVKGAKAAVVKPYTHQEFPKVLHSADGDTALIRDPEHLQEFLTESEKEWAESPSDFDPKKEKSKKKDKA